MSPITKKLLMLGASYLIVASALVTYLQVPAKPVLAGGVLVLAFTLIRHFTRKR